MFGWLTGFTKKYSSFHKMANSFRHYIDHVGFVKHDNLSDGLSHPTGVSVSREGQI